MTTIPKRLAPSKETLIRLFALSGNQCAFPGCTHQLIDEDNTFIAQVCHIESALAGGERFNKSQTNEERRALDNLILLCYQHHIKTDNVDRYPLERMREMKKTMSFSFAKKSDSSRSTVKQSIVFIMIN